MPKPYTPKTYTLNPDPKPTKQGANKGQGFALCERILAEHQDTHVFLCSRSLQRGEEAGARLSKRFNTDRVDLVQLDVTDDESVHAAARQVRILLHNIYVYVNT